MTLCARELPVDRGSRPRLVPLLEEAGHQVTLVEDGRLDSGPESVVFLAGNANWFPRVCRQLMATPTAERPLVLVWHSEPLPPPKAAGW